MRDEVKAILHLAIDGLPYGEALDMLFVLPLSAAEWCDAIRIVKAIYPNVR